MSRRAWTEALAARLYFRVISDEGLGEQILQFHAPLALEDFSGRIDRQAVGENDALAVSMTGKGIAVPHDRIDAARNGRLAGSLISPHRIGLVIVSMVIVIVSMVVVIALMAAVIVLAAIVIVSMAIVIVLTAVVILLTIVAYCAGRFISRSLLQALALMRLNPAHDGRPDRRIRRIGRI